MTPRAALRRRTRIVWRAILRVVVHIMHVRHSPDAIAWGMALGLFIAFTPTVGLQMVLAIALATLLKASRPAALVAVWVTNVATIPPIYACTYWVGNLFWDGPSVGQVYRNLTRLVATMYRLEFYEIFTQFRELMKMGVDVLLPMTIGGIIVGLLAAGIAYPTTKSAVRRYRRFRKRRRKTKRKHMLLRRLHLDRLRHGHKSPESQEEKERGEHHAKTGHSSHTVPPGSQVENMGREET